MDMPVIDIKNLSIGFTGKSGATLPVLRDVDLCVHAGETIGIVGESGSGKSTLALAAMGFMKHGLQKLSGSVSFEGQDMFALTPPQLANIRGGRLGLIPQNSGQALTPTMRIGRQLEEALMLHCDLGSDACKGRVTELLAQVRLPDPETIANRFPHELSGGQQQRVAIAMALAGEPDALLLDEPTTGLDVTTQAHILDLLCELATKRKMAMVYVSHDLGVIARVASRIMVMYAGEVVLEGPAKNVLKSPKHPYARGLLSAIPRLSDKTLPVALDGTPPPPGGALNRCAFADRCALAQDACTAVHPALEALKSGEKARCIRLDALNKKRSTKGAKAVHVTSIDPALSLADMTISYHRPGLLEKLALTGQGTQTPTVDGINLDIKKGETIGLIGESGSGKSTILKTVAGLLPPQSGGMQLCEHSLAARVQHRPADQLRRIQMVFQNPDDSLNPRHSVAQILAQPLKLYFGLTGQALRDRSAELLTQVRLDPHYLDRLPRQLSGGEKQRVAIARALAAKPEVMLCDEITSALDVSVQAAVLDLMNDLKRDQNISFVFVSHDLAVVRALSDQVAILYQGRICEQGPTEAVYQDPSHPYTKMLLGAVLEPDPSTKPDLLADDVVELSPPALGCPFQRRCPRKLANCKTETPPIQGTEPAHKIHCHIPLKDL